MEKETVDYAITKLNEVFAKVAPKAQELGSEFVDYMVMKQTLEWGVYVFLAIIASIFAIYWRKRFGDDWNFDETEHGVPYIIGWFLCGIGAMGMFIEGYSALLANLYPLIWTIEQLAK